MHTLNKFLKTTLVTLAILAVSALGASSALYAATFKISPGSGYVLEDEDFTVDILIDSSGENILLARSVITFDPTKLQLVTAERNNTLFDQYPDSGASTDNENGVIMLEGFTQSGVAPLYLTGSEPDVFARLRFTAVKDGNVTLDWEYNGNDEQFKSVIMADGSPPVNVLNSKPAAVTYKIQDVDNPGATTGSTTPVTSIQDNTMTFVGTGVIVSALLILGGSKILINSGNPFSRKRTVVEVGE